MKYFTMDGMHILPPTAEKKKVSQLQENVCRQNWALDMDGRWLKELLCPLTGFDFNPSGCPYPYNLLTMKRGGGDGLVADNATMKQVSTDLHGTCSKS